MQNIVKKTLIILPLIVLNIAGFIYCQDNKELVSRYYEAGNRYYRQGKYKEAQEQFQKALDLLSQEQKPPVPQIPPAKVKEPVPVPAVPQGAGAASETKPQLEYVIGDEDVLGISIWQNPDLNQEVIVRPDGRISFPLIGDVQAEGLTITQLDNEITERLKEYVKYPEVSISIKKLGGQKVVVLGEVLKPGVYSVTGAKTILEAIALAGGFTRDAVPSSTVVIHNGFTHPEAKRVNLSQALKGDLRQNVSLQTEDVIFIPKKFIADINYFLSQIAEPLSKGSYPYGMIYQQRK